MKKYQPKLIELKWRKRWEEGKIYDFKVSQTSNKYYSLVEYPYPSGDLHIGHWFAFTLPDVIARYKSMNGFNVFFPIGYDAIGLPTENAAIKRGIHPLDWTKMNTDRMTIQFKTMGARFNWNHTLITSDPQYMRWNQWIFIKMFEKDIAYRSKTLSNWCPIDQTVLADEHVEGGKCWRCGSEVVQKEVEQWFLRITSYADRLEWPENPNVDWPISVRVGQNAWIGRSEGLIVKFGDFEVFTTRPDTIFGATFLVVSPEHPLLNKILASEHKKEILDYIKKASKKTELERKENKEKTGVFSGAYVENPANRKKVPVWVADYVLSGYGTGAIMAVPAHDERDFEFAQKFNLPVLKVIEDEKDSDKIPYTGRGILVNSEDFNGLDSEEAKKKISEYLINKQLASKSIQYHLHDWSVSRQRYWGTPVPMIHCPDCGIVPVSDSDLPVTLPYDVDFTPKGKPPLASNEQWLKVKCPKCGGDAKRDAETLDTFFDSSWYFFRYLDPNYQNGAFDPELANRILPVDVYFGGAEHTLGHTLYARFFTKFFKDLGLISFDEFAKKRIQHGIVLGPDGQKMSKSRGNVINPDDVVEEYGSDTTRAYLCFMMPYEGTAPWSTEAISGIYRFLRRVWDLYERINPDFEPEKQDLVQLNKTISKVTSDLEAIKANTALAAIMSWLNFLSSRGKISKKEFEVLLVLLAPFVPHITEELWEMLGNNFSIHQHGWPKTDENYLEDEIINFVIQVNGKVRDNLSSSKNSKEEEIKQLALQSEKIRKYIDGKQIKKTVFVPGKIFNIVL